MARRRHRRRLRGMGPLAEAELLSALRDGDSARRLCLIPLIAARRSSVPDPRPLPPRRRAFREIAGLRGACVGSATPPSSVGALSSALRGLGRAGIASCSRGDPITRGVRRDRGDGDRSGALRRRTNAARGSPHHFVLRLPQKDWTCSCQRRRTPTSGSATPRRRGSRSSTIRALSRASSFSPATRPPARARRPCERWGKRPEPLPSSPSSAVGWGILTRGSATMPARLSAAWARATASRRSHGSPRTPPDRFVSQRSEATAKTRWGGSASGARAGERVY